MDGEDINLLEVVDLDVEMVADHLHSPESVDVVAPRPLWKHCQSPLGLGLHYLLDKGYSQRPDLYH